MIDPFTVDHYAFLFGSSSPWPRLFESLFWKTIGWFSQYVFVSYICRKSFSYSDFHLVHWAYNYFIFDRNIWLYIVLNLERWLIRERVRSYYWLHESRTRLNSMTPVIWILILEDDRVIKSIFVCLVYFVEIHSIILIFS